ncbi:MAG TPA: hypothetical protein VKH63_15350 [Candidatus Acidoferrum sp.]|jgi:hypothetical protein|nr:hypothetical protein [Candidatus Acidoferrum sp.]
MLYVTEQSSVIVHQDANLAAKDSAAELVSGAAVISVTPDTTGKSSPAQPEFVRLQRRGA